MTDDEALHLEREQRELDWLRYYATFCEKYRGLYKQKGIQRGVRFFSDELANLNTRIALQATKVGEMKLKLGVLVP